MAGPAGTLVGRLLTKIVPDTSTFAAELKAKLEAMDLEVEVDVVINQASLRAAQAQVQKAFDNQTVFIRPVTLPGTGGASPNGPNGGRDGQSEFASVRALDPTRLLILLGLLTSPALVAAIASLTAFAGALATGLTGAAGGAGVLTLGLVGLIARFNALQEAGEPLPGYMRDFADELDRVRSAYSSFLDDIAEEGFETLAQGLGIVADVMPRLTPIFLAFNDVVQRALGGLALFLASDEGERMFAFFEGVGAQSFELLLQIVGNLLIFFGRLFEGLGPFAVEVLEGLADATERWADSVDGIGDSPKFQAFLQFVRDTGPLVLEVFRSLRDALTQIGIALAPLSESALNGIIGLFDTIAETDPAILEAIVVGVAAALASFLAISAVLAIIALANPIVAISAALVGLAAAAAVYVSNSPALQDELQGLIDKFLAFDGVTEAIDTVTTAVSDFVDEVSTALSDFLPTLESIADGLQGLFDGLGPDITEALGAVSEGVSSFLGFLGTAFSQGLAFISVLWAAFGPSLLSILEPVLGLILDTWTYLWEQIGGIFDLFSAILTGDWEGAWEAILGIIESHGEFITAVVQGLFDTIVEIFTAIGDQVKVLFEGDWGALVDIVSEKNAEITDDINASTAEWFEGVKAGNERISADVNASWSANFESVRSANERISGNVNASVASWFEGVKAGNARISGDVNSSWSANLESIRAANSNATANINASFSSMLSSVRSYNASITADINSKFSQAVEYIAGAGGRAVSTVQGWMGDLGGAVSGGLSTVLGYFQNLPGQIAGALSGINLSSIGSAIIGSLISGIQSRIGEVRSTLQGLTASIPDWKGPAARDRELLRTPADLIMDGFIDQVRNRFGDVRDVFGRVPIDVTGGDQLAAVGAAGGAGITQQFLIDPRADEGFVEGVVDAAQRGTMRGMNLRYRRV